MRTDRKSLAPLDARASTRRGPADLPRVAPVISAKQLDCLCSQTNDNTNNHNHDNSNSNYSNSSNNTTDDCPHVAPVLTDDRPKGSHRVWHAAASYARGSRYIYICIYIYIYIYTYTHIIIPIMALSIQIRSPSAA